MKNGNYKFLQKNRLRPFLVCLLFTIILWIAQTMSDTYVYEDVYPLKFTGYDTLKYATTYTDSLLPISVKSTGFQLFYKKIAHKNPNVAIDIASLIPSQKKNININLATKNYKTQILEQLSFLNGKETHFLTDTIRISITERCSKKIKPTLTDISFSFAPQYGLYGSPTISPDSITLYGSQHSLDNITSIPTKSKIIKNVKKTGFYELELDPLWKQYSDLTVSSEKIKIYLPIERYTETSVIVPIQFRANDTSIHARLYPEKVEVVLDIAMKDYKKINPNMFLAEVVYDKEISQNILPVFLSHFPSFVRIKKINPENVQFVIIK